MILVRRIPRSVLTAGKQKSEHEDERGLNHLSHGCAIWDVTRADDDPRSALIFLMSLSAGPKRNKIPCSPFFRKVSTWSSHTIV